MEADNFEIMAFEQLENLYYKKNFGQATKQEIDMLMFHLYMEKLRQSSGKISDYKISKELGITQSRVRNYRIKEQLLYPREIDWKDELSKSLSCARYDPPYIVVDIPDPNVMIEIKNYLEEKGKYTVSQNNTRLLTLRVEFYLDLAVELDPESDKKKIYKSLVKKVKKDSKNEIINIENDISIKNLVDAGVNVTTIAANLTSILSPQNYLMMGIGNLMGL